MRASCLFALLPLLARPVFAAPIRLPMPLRHINRRLVDDLLGGSDLPLSAPQSLPLSGLSNGPLSGGLLSSGPLVGGSGVLSPIADSGLLQSIPLVPGLLDTTTDLLDTTLSVGLDTTLVTLATLAPILDLSLGVHLDLEANTWLKCNKVSGPFGGRDYDLGCACSSDAGLLLQVDVDAVVNVAGLDVWVEAQVELGTGGWYPAGAWPTCDGNGGWTCSTGVSFAYVAH